MVDRAIIPFPHVVTFHRRQAGGSTFGHAEAIMGNSGGVVCLLRTDQIMWLNAVKIKDRSHPKGGHPLVIVCRAKGFTTHFGTYQ